MASESRLRLQQKLPQRVQLGSCAHVTALLEHPASLPPVAPEGHAPQLGHARSPASPAAQRPGGDSGLGTRTWYLVGPVVFTMGAAQLRMGLEVLGHTRQVHPDSTGLAALTLK